MELRDYLRAMRRRWWLILTAVLGSLALAAAVTARMEPQYATSVTFFVTTPTNGVADAYQGGLFSQQRVKSYADLLTSDRLARDVVDYGGLFITPDEVRARIRPQAVADTVMLRATVVDGSPDMSQQIAATLAVRFIALVEGLETRPGSRTPSVKVEVVGGPRLNPAPVEPRPVRNLTLAALLGLMMGTAVAVLREVLDTSVKSGDLLGELSGSPVLGTVPYDGSARKEPLIVAGGAQSVRAEAYRRVRTNLQFVDVDDPVRTIVVTSAVPGEGKSITASNLAISFAEAGKRILLMDADLRMPRVAEYLGLEGAAGLTNVLAGQVSVTDVVQPWGRGGLWVLPSGSVPPNPSELLGSQQMAELLDSFRARFDAVILDAPPLLPVTDAAVVAGRVDGAILVTRCGRTTRAQVGAATDALRAVGARVLGCVLNMVPTKGEGSYYGYNYGYGYGYGEPSVKDIRRPRGSVQPPAPVDSTSTRV